MRFVRGALLFCLLSITVLSVLTAISFRANSQSNDALCALRGDLQRRVVTSREFLVEHPDGIPGISAKTIRDGIDNQKRTIVALSGLSCPK